MPILSTSTTLSLPAGQAFVFEAGSGAGTAVADPGGRNAKYSIGPQQTAVGPFSTAVNVSVVIASGTVGYRTDLSGSDSSDQKPGVVDALLLTGDGLTKGGAALTAGERASVGAALGIDAINERIGMGSYSSRYQDPIKGIAIQGGYAYLRASWNATLDAIHRVRIYSTDQTINAPVDFYGVKTIPLGTANTLAAIVSANTSGTTIAAQGDSVGPLNYNGSYVGGNHGPSIGHIVTAVAHGKTATDVGSEWNGPASRKFYIFKIVDADRLFLVSNNSGTTAQWSFYSSSLSGQTLTHSSGATNTASVVITADTASQQILPFLNKRALRVEIDGNVINHAVDGFYIPSESFKIFENYSIVSPSAAVDFVSGRAGSSPVYYDDLIPSDVDLQNIHTFHSTGSHTIDQTVTFNQAVNLSYQGVVQDWPPQNLGVLSMYVPGVASISGVDYRANADISGVVVPFTTPQATWLDQSNAPNRMAQTTSTGGVNKAGVVVGYSPITGRGTRVKRAIAAASDAGGMASGATKKMYPRAVGSNSQPTAGLSYRMVGFHHVYNCETVPDATIATWFRDGSDVIAVFDFHKASTASRMNLPSFCDGWDVSMIDSQNTTLINSTVIDGGGVGVSCSGSYGFAVLKVSKKV